jgi:DNA-binding protein H-NS
VGELVSLCQYRAQKRQEAEAAAQAEVDALREIVDAWIEVMGEPESAPIVVLSGETLEPVTFGDWTDWS